MELDIYDFGRSLREVSAFARDVEASGFGGLWFAETAHNPFLLSAISAIATERIMVGTAVAVAFPRSPMVTAQAAWDLADASEGRFVLGLGTQVKSHVERRYSVPYERPAKRMREYVCAVRAIFDAFQHGTPLEFSGDFYRFSLLPPFFSAGPIDHPAVPIYIAGVNRGIAQVAGEVADGLHAHPLHSVRYLREVVLPAIGAGAAHARRSVADVALVVPVFVAVGTRDEDVERQRAAIRALIAFYGSTRTYRAVFELHGWPDLPSQLHEMQSRGDSDGMTAVVTDEILDTVSVTASWDGLAPLLRDRYEGIAARVMPYSVSAGWRSNPEIAERWRAVATELHASDGV